MKKETIPYSFEQGPIRPPAEANSLLLRLTRNCPWNHCTFCPIYKNETFSIRPIEHVIRDIDTAYEIICAIKNNVDGTGQLTQSIVDKIAKNVQPVERSLFNAVLHWYVAGMTSIFFQDANSLIVKPSDLIEILHRINTHFPDVERITTFGRTQTILSISDENFETYAALGLNRVHAGLETGSDTLLKLVKKGCTKEMHVRAGHKLQKAGIELSECVLLGLGGKMLSKEHALETADAINQINPPIIRFLTLVAPRGVQLYPGSDTYAYVPSRDLDVVKEIKLFLQHLNGVTAYIESNNILNLLQEVEGVMPDSKPKMIDALNTFINLTDEQRMLFQVGKRLRIFSGLKDLVDPNRVHIARKACNEYGITDKNVDHIINEIVQSYMG